MAKEFLKLILQTEENCNVYFLLIHREILELSFVISIDKQEGKKGRHWSIISSEL